jgi:ATP-dependent protease ClpP protease subunit
MPRGRIFSRSSIALNRATEAGPRPRLSLCRSVAMERDYFMTAAEAKEYGMIDNVIAHRFE